MYDDLKLKRTEIYQYGYETVDIKYIFLKEDQILPKLQVVFKLKRRKPIYWGNCRRLLCPTDFGRSIYGNGIVSHTERKLLVQKLPKTRLSAGQLPNLFVPIAVQYHFYDLY